MFQSGVKEVDFWLRAFYSRFYVHSVAHVNTRRLVSVCTETTSACLARWTLHTPVADPGFPMRLSANPKGPELRSHLYRPQRSWGKVIFSEACVNNSVQRGACVVAPGGHMWLLWGGMHGCSQGGCAWLLPGGMHGCSQGGHAWLLPGGMHGCSWGACVVALGGHAWLLPGGHVWLLPGGCVVAPRGCVVAARGHAWLLPGGACMGYDEIRRYDQWAGGTHPTGMHSCTNDNWFQSPKRNATVTMMSVSSLTPTKLLPIVTRTPNYPWGSFRPSENGSKSEKGHRTSDKDHRINGKHQR